MAPAACIASTQTDKSHLHIEEVVAMLARFGRVVYWFCCGIAVLLATVPAVFHGLFLLSTAPPPLSDVDLASLHAISPEKSRITYLLKLPRGELYELDYNLFGEWTKYRRSQINLPTGYELIQEPELPEQDRSGSAHRMPELDRHRVQRNIAKMVSMNAPQSDIYAYIGTELATIDARNISHQGNPANPVAANSVAAAGLFDDLIPAKQLEMLEEAERRGILPPENKPMLHEVREKVALSQFRKEIEADHASRASHWLTFYQIVPFSLLGALALVLFGRAVRYILANE